MRLSSAAALVAALLAATLPPRAAEADPSPVDRATAQSLFDDARKLIDGGRFGEACPKLAESLRLDFGLGTMLRLADCYDRNGQTASAWAMFVDAADEAKKTNDGREKVSRDRAAALLPKVSKVVVRLAEPDLAGLVVKRDGEVLGKALYGTAAPVDPGTHQVVASAPGKVTWTGKVAVPAGGATTTLDVPALAAEPVASTPVTSTSAAPPPKPPPAPESHARTTAGLVLGGAGIVALGVGTVLFLGAKSKHDDAVSSCQSGTGASGAYVHCGDDARSANDSAKSRGTIADAVLGVGGLLVIAGGVLAFTSLGAGEKERRGDEATGLRISPQLGTKSGGLAVGGAF